MLTVTAIAMKNVPTSLYRFIKRRLRVVVACKVQIHVGCAVTLIFITTTTNVFLNKLKIITNDEMRSKFEKAKNDQERAEMLYVELENQKQSCKNELLQLSNELLHKIKEFEELGVARNYVKLIETQLAVIETRLESTVGSEREDLRKTQEKLKKKLDLIKGAQSATLD